MRNNQRRLGATARPQAPSAPPAQSGLAFAVPTEFVELPSRGEYYSEDHPFYKQEAVEIRFMTAKDEDILSSQALLKKGLVIDRLLESLIVADVDASSLLIGDRSALLIAARISSYGDEYNVMYTCPKCLTKNEVNFDLKQGKISDLCFDEEHLKENEITYDPETLTFDLTLPVSGVTVGLALIDGETEKQFTEDDQDSLITTMLSIFLVKANGETDPDQVYSFIESMPARDSKYVRDIYPTLIPSFQLLHEFQCTACLYIEETEVPLSADFFWPK